jgi:hypothetical protein
MRTQTYCKMSGCLILGLRLSLQEILMGSETLRLGKLPLKRLDQSLKVTKVNHVVMIVAAS